jgi:hypothetical protein
MELPGDVGQEESRLGVLGDGVNLGEIFAWFAPNDHGHGNHFGLTR